MTGIEKGLVERFRSGEVDAFDELYGKTVDRIYRFALRLTGNPEDAEDVTAETFAAAYRSREGFQERSSVETWLFRIAVHQARRLKRKGKLRTGNAEAEVCARSDSDMRMVELMQLVLNLPEALRIPFLLVKSEGLTYHETGEVLKKPTGTVQWMVAKASKTIRDQWCDPPDLETLEVPEVCRYEL